MDKPDRSLAVTHPSCINGNTWESRNVGHGYTPARQTESATSSHTHTDSQHTSTDLNNSIQASDVDQPLASTTTLQSHPSTGAMSSMHYASSSYTSSYQNDRQYSQDDSQHQQHLHGDQQDFLHSTHILSSNCSPYPNIRSSVALPRCATPVTGPGGDRSSTGGQSASSTNAVYEQDRSSLQLQPAPSGRVNASGYSSSSSSDLRSHGMQPASSSSSSCASYAAYPYGTASRMPGEKGYSNHTVAASSAGTELNPNPGTWTSDFSRSSHSTSRHDQHYPLFSATPVFSATLGAEAGSTSYPESSTQEWPREDILSLVYILNEVEGRSWTEIAKRAFPDDKYTPNDCQEKWKEFSKDKKTVNRGPWSHEEDQALLNATNLLGPDKWVVIATQVEARNGKQCRERWHNHLSPSIKKGPFTPEEDETIFHWYSIVGSKWSEIAKQLPGRPDNMIKNHFNTSLQRQRRRLNRESGTSARKGAPLNELTRDHIADARSTSDRSTTIAPNTKSGLLFFSQNIPLPVSFPMSNSNSSSSVVSSAGRSDWTSSTSLPCDSISQYALAISSGPLTSSGADKYPPVLSLGDAANNVNMACSPALSSRHPSAYTRPSFHPYARGSYQVSQHDAPHRSAMPQDPGATEASASHGVEQQLTPPTTPEYELRNQRYPTSGPYYSGNLDMPASAPPSREYFNLAPRTPARRATLAGSPRRFNQTESIASNTQSQEMSPMTATSHAFGNMFFGRKTNVVPVEPGFEASHPQRQEDNNLIQMDMPAPRAMQLSSLLSSSGENSPNLGLGLTAPQACTPVRSDMLDSCNDSTTPQDQSCYSSHGTSTLYPHLQPAPPPFAYTTLSNADVCYTPRNGSFSSSSAGTSASLMSPMSSFQSPSLYSGGFPTSASSVGSMSTSLASLSSANTQLSHYPRKNSVPSPGGFYGPTPQRWDQFASPQAGHAYPCARGRGYYQPNSPMDSSSTTFSRSRANSDVQSSTSESFAPPFPNNASHSRVGGLLGGRGSISGQSIQEVQEESMHEGSTHTAASTWNASQQASYPVYTCESQPYSSTSSLEMENHAHQPPAELAGLPMQSVQFCGEQGHTEMYASSSS